MPGFESQQGKKTYVDLYPLGYNPTNVVIGKEQLRNHGSTFYTINAEEFWAKPEGEQ